MASKASTTPTLSPLCYLFLLLVYTYITNVLQKPKDNENKDKTMAPMPPKVLQATNQSVIATAAPTTRGRKTTASKPLLSKSKEIENHLTDLDIRSEIKNSVSAKKLLLSHG
jgi:hypothetical protein